MHSTGYNVYREDGHASMEDFVGVFMKEEITAAVREFIPRQFETYVVKDGSRHLEIEYQLWRRSLDVITKFYFVLGGGDEEKMQEIAESEEGQHWFKTVRKQFVEVSLRTIQGGAGNHVSR